MAAEIPAPDDGRIDLEEASQAFAALGSEQRLNALSLLVRVGPEGIPVGEIQKRLGLPASTLNHHLKFLAAAGLVAQERQARSVICRACFDRVKSLADFLMRECCAESPGEG